MANIVYKITFLDRIEKNEPPFYYIGSKTNCTVINGVIFDKKGKQYKGSCRTKLFKEAIYRRKSTDFRRWFYGGGG